MQERLTRSCHLISSLVDELASKQGDTLIRIGHELAEIFTRGGQLILAGNGSLQAVAQQTASAFSHRLGFERPPLPAVALGGNSTFTAALLADHQPHEILAREYRTHNERDHMLLVFSAHQDSPQIRHLLEQIEDSRSLVMIGPEKTSDKTNERQHELNINVPGDSPARLAELSLICGHLLCELVEGELFGV